MIILTLNNIRKHSPCADEWKKLLTTLGKKKADNVPFPLETVLDSNGLDEALWCLQAVEGKDREIRLLAVAFARSVQHLIKDPTHIHAIDVAEKYARSEATEEELVKARNAIWISGRSGDEIWLTAWATTTPLAHEAANATAWEANLSAPAETSEEKQAEIFRRFCRKEEK